MDRFSADSDGVFQSMRLSDKTNLLLLVTLFLFNCIYYILTLGDWEHCWYSGSLLLHYLNTIVIITCPAGLMIKSLAAALIDAQLFYKSGEVIDIVPNVVRDNWAGR